MIITLYIRCRKTTVDVYLNAYGLFNDIWAPITEACLNIGLSILFGYFWGLNGILYAQPIADVLSALITVFMAIPLHKSLTIAEQKMKTTSIPCDRQ